ncbi:MAG: hypothetical protein CSA96_07080 [Bacteroidetes bacterium]|nr:MAG: hypothetical protein CSA96_07080 [Bacteroidota bacterium]
MKIFTGMKQVKPVQTIVLGAVFTGLLISCEELIEIDLNRADPVLVAEGYMEKDSLCRVRLSLSSDYFSADAEEPVEDATVRVLTADGEEELLTCLGDGVYKGSRLRGTPDKDYTLEIDRNGKHYAGSSYLYPPAEIRGIFSEELAFAPPRAEGLPRMVILFLTDHPGRPDNYLLKVMHNQVPVDLGYFLATDMYGENGSSLEMSLFLFGTEVGDTLELRLYSIDQKSYVYCSQLNETLYGRMATSATPYNPASNLGEGIMGYFMARSRIDTVFIVE